MKPEKLPSGNWRVRVYLGKIDGKQKWKSVTGKTKQEALIRANMYNPSDFGDDLRLAEACQQFLEIRGVELSPSTLRGYMGTFSRYIEKDKIGNVRLSDLKTSIVQEWVSRFPRDMKSKSKKNHLGFLVTVVKYFCEDKSFRVRIRESEPDELYTPTLDEVNQVIACADETLRRAILLGIFGMRRGEICALDASDIDRENNLVRINKALAKGPDGKWIQKMPKTRRSIRWVSVPASIIKTLPEDGPVIGVSPDIITLRFVKAVKRAKVPHFRFHDLRAFFASMSISSAIGAGEMTVQKMGGWKTNNVLKRHYERSISDMERRDTDKILDYFSEHLKIEP